MCGCEHHFDESAPCRCLCPEHLRVTQRRLSEVMESLPCRYCDAPPFMGCVSKSGFHAPMHSARWYDAKAATA